MPIPCCLITIALKYSLISGSVIPPTLFFFLKIAEAICGLFWFYINLWNICSSSVKYTIGMLIGIASDEGLISKIHKELI